MCHSYNQCHLLNVMRWSKLKLPTGLFCSMMESLKTIETCRSRYKSNCIISDLLLFDINPSSSSRHQHTCASLKSHAIQRRLSPPVFTRISFDLSLPSSRNTRSPRFTLNQPEPLDRSLPPTRTRSVQSFHVKAQFGSYRTFRTRERRLSHPYHP